MKVPRRSITDNTSGSSSDKDEATSARQRPVLIQYLRVVPPILTAATGAIVALTALLALFLR